MSEFYFVPESNDHTPGQTSADNTQPDGPMTAFAIWPPSHDPYSGASSVIGANGVIGGDGGPSTYTSPVSLMRNEATAAEDAFNSGVIGVGNSLGSAALTGYAEVEAKQAVIIYDDLQKVRETGVLG